MAMWTPLTELPDLRRVGLISLDTETKDDSLAADRGSGWATRQGHLCGVSVAYRAENDIRAHYIPLRHPDSENFEPARVYRWLADHVAAADVRFVTQNGLYDWGWLRTEADIRMPAGERIEELGALATLVDENRYRYSLDALCEWRGLPGKDETALREGCVALDLITNKRKKFKPQNYLWQLPARYVGPYAEGDTTKTLQVFEDLNPILDREKTRGAYRLECALLPMVLAMRRRGIRIDVAAAERVQAQLIARRDAVLTDISSKLGISVSMAELARNKWLADTFDREGIAYPRTEKGNPSFTGGQKGWMDRHAHWLPQLICEANKYNMIGVNFVGKYILDYTVNGRVHAEIHPHRSENNGTKSFRFSYSDPPLQLMPARDEELTPLIRGLFLPEEGEVWAKPDASQQEFRLAVHYAAMHNVPKTDMALARYRDDPDTDFHALAGQMTGLARKDAKNVNFAKIYGAGVRKFAVMIGRPENEAQAIYEQYDRELPFLRTLGQIYQSIANKQGFVTLYDGARRHFDKWAPGGKWETGAGPCDLAEAQRRLKDSSHPWYGKAPLYRADTRNALNALIQGSAARHTKLWMQAVWREGITPMLQMHDCLDCSVATREQAEIVARLCSEVVQLKVPMRVDLKFGRNWGDAKHSWEEIHGEVSTQPTSITVPAESVPAESVPAEALHICTHQEPDGSEQQSTYNDEWLHPGCVDAFARERMAAQNIPWGLSVAEPTPTAQPPIINGFDFEPAVGVASLRDIVAEPMVDGKVLCPFHDDHNPSCHIYDDGFKCFVCGAHGDAIDWLRETEDLTFQEAVEALECWEPSARPQAHNPQETLHTAKRLWDAAGPIAGTPAMDYLTFRGIDVDQLTGSPDAVLRFHPNCTFKGGPHPCLLALLQDIDTDEFAGIHRIALTPNAFTAGAHKVERRSLGRWPRRRAIKLWPATRWLVLAEGLETTLAASTRLTHNGHPLRPAWTMVSAKALERCGPIPGVECVVLLADNDPTGLNATQIAAQELNDSGCRVVVLTPRTVNDFNDVAIARLP
jgi:DNA polymerase I-like protein with 3'-5' exonuclease and polymerase domains